ncbi:hypothetical protein [Pedobacter sp.]|jgi:hypothetical protein|uniref:hypothetical protein n=1 Tax=Pedobacter sp. TaxID=1411316 RepID=UPI002BF86161|nr:hypothetical protein [Pedobacter sp.]HWW39313.1 hypothetical protein [Pedobacter sp.]
MESQNQINEFLQRDIECKEFLDANPGIKKSLHHLLAENARLNLELIDQQNRLNKYQLRVSAIALIFAFAAVIISMWNYL